MADKAGKIVVLEVIREEVTSKFRRAPYYKSSVIFTPGDDMVSGRVVHELVSFGQEWGGHRFVGVQRKQYALAVIEHESHLR